jgi:hypothetical protein
MAERGVTVDTTMGERMINIWRKKIKKNLKGGCVMGIYLCVARVTAS